MILNTSNRCFVEGYYRIIVPRGTQRRSKGRLRHLNLVSSLASRPVSRGGNMDLDVYPSSLQGVLWWLWVTKDDKKEISSHLSMMLAFSKKILTFSPQHLLFHSQRSPNSHCWHNQCTCRFLQNQNL